MNVNRRFQYLGQGSFISNVIVRTHTHLPSTQPGPLNW